MSMTDAQAWWRSVSGTTVARARRAAKSIAAPLARPFLDRLYPRIDARTAAAVRATQASTDDGLDALSEQLELTRTAALASAAAARELRREHEELRAKIVELEQRLRQGRERPVDR